jgi:GNAT superfamily N-acetyltransferase
MIRAAETHADFALCAEIYNDVEPEQRLSVEDVATSRGVSLLCGTDGYAYVARSSVAGSTLTMVRVRPSARGRGVGSALLAAAGPQAVALGRERMWGRVREADEASLRFVSKRGFERVGRDVDVLLAVAPGDGAFADGVIPIAPEHERGAYEVAAEAAPEMALPQIAAAPPFEEWLEQEARLDAVGLVALDGTEVVGYAKLYRVPSSDVRLENGLTAVKRTHRRRGIALALKQAQIAWAAEHGYTEIVSSMVEANAPMRALNERLGYRELPASIVVEGPAS